MKGKLAVLVITLAFLPSVVRAQERAGDAALGALSGAVVLGPIGAVAGALVGYTAGPSIAHSWGMRRSSAAPRARPTKQARRAQTQVASESRAATSDRVAGSSTPAPGPAAPSSTGSIGARETIPPVQGFD